MSQAPQKYKNKIRKATGGPRAPRPARKRQRNIRKNAQANTAMKKTIANVASHPQWQIATRDTTRMGMAFTKQMMTPFDVPVHRLPTVDMPRVAVSKFRYTNEFRESVQFHDSTYLAKVYGQPGLTYMDGPFALTSSRYDLVFGSGGQVWDVSGYNFVGTSDEPLGIWWPLTGDIYTSGSRRQEDYVPILSSGDITWAFLQEGEGLYMNAIAVGGGAGTLTFSIYKEIGELAPNPVLRKIGSCTANGAPGTTTLIYTAPNAGFYAVRLNEFTVTTAPVSTLSLTAWGVSTTTTAWALHYLTDMQEDTTMARDMRRTACTLLVTNTASALNAQGDVYGARILHTDYGDFPTSRFERAADKYTGKAVNGAYTYMEFSNADEAFLSYITGTGHPRCYLPSGLINVIKVTNGAFTLNPNTFLISQDNVVEFKTSSQRYPLTVSSGNVLDLVESRRISNMTPYFYTNKWHWGEIAKLIAAAYSGMRRYAVPIGTGLAAAFPEYAPAIMTGAKLLAR